MPGRRCQKGQRQDAKCSPKSAFHTFTDAPDEMYKVPGSETVRCLPLEDLWTHAFSC